VVESKGSQCGETFVAMLIQARVDLAVRMLQIAACSIASPQRKSGDVPDSRTPPISWRPCAGAPARRPCICAEPDRA